MSRLGIIAGGGSLPGKLIDACQSAGRAFFVLALEGQTDKNILKDRPHAWTKLGAVNQAISVLKEQHVDALVMAGGVRRPSLWEIKPDWRALQIFARLGAGALGDDALLRAIAEELEKEGFKIKGAHEIDPGLLTPEGVLTKKQPSAEDRKDLDHAITIVKTLGQMDVGQAAVVQQGIVLGVEAVEGTDALLKRCRTLRRKGKGGVLVKTAKPQQDRRLDLPAVGLRTIARAYEAGLEGIAVEAGASLMLDRDEVIAAADKMGLFVVGIKC